MYRMLSSDIDGTILNSQGKLIKENIEAVKRLIDKGIIVSLCTGRNISRAVPIAKKLGIKAPIVCIDGILLYDTQLKRPVNDMVMDFNTAVNIIEIGKKYGVFTEVSNGFGYYKHIPNKEFIKYDFNNHHTPTGYIKSYLGGVRYLNSYEMLKGVPGNIYQVTIGCDKSVACHIADEIRSLAIEGVDVRDSLWPNYVFVNKSGADKSRGIDILCRMYDINPENVVAIGDDMNDIGMFKFCGMGVPMKNAAENIQKAADYVTDTNDNGGFAKACEQFFGI